MMIITGSTAVEQGYDCVVAGTGFGSLFFVYGLLKRNPGHRILMVEWGDLRTHDWQVENQLNSTIRHDDTFERRSGEKPWYFTIGYGGGTNCWWANTPRLHPNDFRLKSRYGVGEDWPISYDDLEPFYCEAEDIMQVAGPDDSDPVYPRSRPYPMPPHRLSTADRMVKAATPGAHFALPMARLSRHVDGRGPCCNSVQCSFCPTNAKFTALNTFGHLEQLPNVHILTGARVMAVEMEAGVAKGLRFVVDGRESVARGDVVAVGCNGIHSPFILMRSGLSDAALGRYLHEKRVLTFEAYLDGVDHFDGGAPIAGYNTTLVDGDHRRDGGGAMVFFTNEFTREGLRPEFGRWRQTLPIEVFVEDLPQASNGVEDTGSDKPLVSHASRSAYCDRGVEHVLARLPEILAPLPVERLVRHRDIPTGKHIQGTCRMGADPATSVVDGGLVHHRVRNLLVLGTSVWPSCGTANPSLTAAALSLRAATLLGGTA